MMQKIRSKETTVDSLLRQQFHLDFYQRNYKWKTPHVEQLLRDLKWRFLQDYNRQHKPQQVANYCQYFLGSIIISEQNGKRYIVDGQQRLTTLTLLLIFLDRLQQESMDSNRYRRKIEVGHLIYQTDSGRKSFNLQVEDWRSGLEDLINGKPCSTIKRPSSVKNLVGRFNDIQEYFSKEFPNELLPYFMKWMIGNVVFSEVTAYSTSDAYMIFETMNDRGLPLTPTEMLQGHLIAKIPEDQKRTAAYKKWQDELKKLHRRDSDEDNEWEDSLFITSWLRGRYADKAQASSRRPPEDFERLHTEFHRWARENENGMGIDTSDGVNSLIRCQIPFYVRAHKRAREAAFDYNRDLSSVLFNYQNNFVLQHPLMLASLRPKKNDNDKDYDNDDTVMRKMQLVSTFVEILLARRIWAFRAIYESVMKARVLRIMKKIREKELDELQDILAHELVLAAEDGFGVDFESNTDNDQAFGLNGKNKPGVHNLLARLTAFLEESSGLESSDRGSRFGSYCNRSHYHIEHVWANNEYEKRHKHCFVNLAEFRQYRDRIGGLVLLTKETNLRLGDKPYPQKLGDYANENLLARSLHGDAYKNSRFRRFNERQKLSFSEIDDFRRTALDARQKLYTKLAKLCWSPDRLGKI